MVRADLVQGYIKRNVPGIRVLAAKTPYAPKIIPLSGQAEVKDISQVKDIALHAADGFKVLMVDDTPTLNYLLAGLVTLSLDDGAKRGKITGSWATGGTWEAARFALGMSEFLKNFYGVSLPVEAIVQHATLDDYFYTVQDLLATALKIGDNDFFRSTRTLPYNYGDEQREWMRRAGLDLNCFVGAPKGFPAGMSMKDVEKLWRWQLDNWVRKTHVQMHGIGTNGHDAFNEPWSILLSQTLTSEQKIRAVLEWMQTRYVQTLGVTRAQNGFAFEVPIPGKDGMSSMFRNVAGAYGLHSLDDIYGKCRLLAEEYKASGQKPDEFDYVDEKTYGDFILNLEEKWHQALDVIKNMPSGAFTQGISDLNGASWFDLVGVNGGHKRRATKGALEGEIDPSCPASAFQCYPNTLVVVERQAGKLLENMAEYFHFAPDSATKTQIDTYFLNKIIDALFWGKPCGVEI